MTLKDTDPTNHDKADNQPVAYTVNTRSSSSKDNLDYLLLNVPSLLQVRISRRNLTEAVICEVKAALASTLIEPSKEIAEVVSNIVFKHGLDRTMNASFGVTRLGDSLMFDEHGYNARQFIEAAYEKAGLENALTRIDALRSRYLGRPRLEDQATNLAQAMLDDLDAVDSFGSHLECLRRITDWLAEMVTLVDQQITFITHRKTDLESRLRSNNAPQRQSSRRLPVLGRLRDRFNEIKERYQQETSGANVLEVELLRVTLRLTVLEAEKLIVEEIARLLTSETQIDENALVVLRDQQGKALEEARRYEWVRDYGIAAGEMLLNSRTLTGAAINYLWDEEYQNLSRIILSQYAAAHEMESLVTATGGVLTPEVWAEIEGIIRTLVEEKLAAFTVTDALVALQRYGAFDMQGKLRAAIKKTASLDFLAHHYADHLDLQTFASITYPPSPLPQSDFALRRMLDEAIKTVNLNIAIETDSTDVECLRFYCERFCVPASAFAFYADTHDAFEQVRHEARFNPHPELNEPWS